jgi:hypothetical protein
MMEGALRGTVSVIERLLAKQAPSASLFSNIILRLETLQQFLNPSRPDELAYQFLDAAVWPVPSQRTEVLGLPEPTPGSRPCVNSHSPSI